MLLPCPNPAVPVFSRLPAARLLIPMGDCLALVGAAVHWRTLLEETQGQCSVICLDQRFRKGVGGQKGLARGDPLYARNSGLFPAPFFPCPLKKEYAILGNYFGRNLVPVGRQPFSKPLIRGPAAILFFSWDACSDSI